MKSEWIHEAAQLPLAFAQVREDALLDLAVVRAYPGPARVLMIASGGCTAAALVAGAELAALHLVDFNPAQLALARLKLHLLVHASPRERLGLLGHAPMPPLERAARLREVMEKLGIPSTQFGPEPLVAGLGLDHAGRYERVFARLRFRLADVADDLTELLSMSDPAVQSDCITPGTALGSALDDALADAMNLPSLVTLFGPEATANPAQPFHRHFAGRIRHALSTLPAAHNPFLAQMLLGRFAQGVFYPWLQAERVSRLPETRYDCGRMKDVLRKVPEASYDVVHLSNILDWLSPSAAMETLALAARALGPGGTVVIRQLNSTLDIPGLGAGFEWQAGMAAELHRRDRSFFYRGFYLGKRKDGA